MPPDEAALVSDPSAYRRMGEPLENVATVRQVSSVSELLSIIESSPFSDCKWAFRGQGQSEWRLKSSIERTAYRPGRAEDYTEREFKRCAHHYLRDLPNDEEDLEWLGLMQHHGAPTRLVDWTKSAHIAAFFAAKSASPPKSFAIWAVDQESVNAQALAMLGTSGTNDPRDAGTAPREIFRRIYRDPAPNGLYLALPIRPFRMSERLDYSAGLVPLRQQPPYGF